MAFSFASYAGLLVPYAVLGWGGSNSTFMPCDIAGFGLEGFVGTIATGDLDVKVNSRWPTPGFCDSQKC